MKKLLLFLVTCRLFVAIEVSRAATQIFSLPDQQIIPTLFDLEGGFHASPMVNVLTYGADTNGVSDSRAAFVAALAKVPVGGILYVPRGTYLFSSAWTLVKSSYTIVGEKGAKWKFNAAVMGVTSWVFQGSNIRIRGLDFDGNALAFLGPYFDTGCVNVSVADCIIEGFLANDTNDPSATALCTGLHIHRGCQNFLIGPNNIFTNITHVTSGANRVSGGVTIADTGYTTSADQIKNIWIFNNLFTGIAPGNEGTGIRVNTQYNSYDGTQVNGYPIGLKVFGNHGVNNGKRSLMKVIGNGVTVIGNTSEATFSSQFSAASFYGSDIVVSDNLFWGTFPDRIIEFGSGGPEITDGIVCTGNRAYSTSGSAAGAQFIRITGGIQNAIFGNNAARNVGYLVYGTGRISNLAINGLSGTNILADGVHLDTDGSFAPTDVSVNHVSIKGLTSNALFFGAGTNLYFSDVRGGPNSFASGLPVFGANNERTVLQASDQAFTSNATLADANMGAISLEANKKYKWKAHIQINNAGTAAGAKIAMVGPTSPTAVILTGVLETATGAILHQTVSSFTTIIAGAITTTGLKYATLEGEVTNGANRGDLKIQFAQNTSDANTTTFKAGSFLTVTEIPQ